MDDWKGKGYMPALLICRKTATDVNPKIRDDSGIYNIKRTETKEIFILNSNVNDYLIKFTNFEDS